MENNFGEPIPWVYSDSPGILMWTWVTDHFVARVTGAEVADPQNLGNRVIRSYAWELGDLMRTNQGLARVIIEGVSARFEDAEMSIREHVGKSYDPRLGYQKYCGALHQIFRLTTGAVINVGPMVGTRCTVVVLLPSGRHETVRGDLSLSNYKWRLRDKNQVLEIAPEHVLSITNKSEVAERATELVRDTSYSGIGRIYLDEWTKGCTGSPGFDRGTVDHVGADQCPVHEGSISREALR